MEAGARPPALFAVVRDLLAIQGPRVFVKLIIGGGYGYARRGLLCAGKIAVGVASYGACVHQVCIGNPPAGGA